MTIWERIHPTYLGRYIQSAIILSGLAHQRRGIAAVLKKDWMDKALSTLGWRLAWVEWLCTSLALDWCSCSMM